MHQQGAKVSGRKRRTRFVATMAAVVAVVALALGGTAGSAGASVYVGGDLQPSASWSS